MKIFLNKNSEKVTLDMDTYKDMIPGNFKPKNIIADRQISVNNTLVMEAKTAMILEIE
ncbi:MAG: cyclomaltodextrinase C-terminal domain-containing protein [Chitinophagaceae bacterium]